MRLLGRFLIGAFLLMVLALAGAGAYLAFFFDANDLKPRLAAAVQARTGKPVAIDGDLSLSLLPAPRAVVGASKLGDLASFQQASTSIALLPLLRGRVVLRELVVEGLDLTLTKGPDGVPNWAMPQSSGGGGIVIEQLRLEGARASYSDQQRRSQIQASAINLTAAPIRAGEPTSLELDCTLASGREQLDGPISLRGRVLAEVERSRYVAEDLLLEVRASGASLSGRLDVDLASLTGTAAFALSALDLAAEARLQAEQGKFDASFSLAEFNPRLLLERLGRKPPATKDAQALTRAALRLEMSGNGNGIEAVPSGRLDASTIAGRIDLTAYDPPRIRFDLRIDQVDLDRYAPPAPSPPRDPAAPDALSKLSHDALRELGLDIAGTLRIGRLGLNGDITRNYVTKLEWDP